MSKFRSDLMKRSDRNTGFRTPADESDDDNELCGWKGNELQKMEEYDDDDDDDQDETSITETEDIECQNHEIFVRHFHDSQNISELSVILEDDENDYSEVLNRHKNRGPKQTHKNKKNSSMLQIDDDDNDNEEGDGDDDDSLNLDDLVNSDSMRKKLSKRASSSAISIASQSISKAAQSTQRKVGRFTNKARIKIFGEDYTKNEGLFVVFAGCIISLNIGMINGTTLSGLLGSTPSTTETAAAAATVTTTTKRSVMGFSTYYTLSALAMADGDWDAYVYNVGLILSYVLGAFIAGILTPKAQPYRIEPMYGPTFVIGGLFLLTASLLAAYEFRLQYVFYCCSVANGIQNGVASIYSSNLIRCGITGATTDAALAFAQLLRGNRRKPWKSIIIVLVIISFWFGGLFAFWLSRRFLKYTLFFNTILFWLVGISLIFFLVKQLKISIRNAICGTWSWKYILEQLAKSSGLPNETAMTHERLLDLFEELDDDGNGYIDHNELMVGLLRGGVSINSSQIKVLVNSADSNNDGLIDRDEWAVMVRKML